MKNERRTTLLMTYMSVTASIFSIIIFTFFFTGMFSREMMLSIVGALTGVLASMVAIYFHALTKRGTIRVFISYAHADADRVKKIREYLRMKGFVVTEPETIVRIGDDITRAVDNAVQSSDCIILVLSKQSVSSQWVRKEIEKAQQSGKRLYPLLIDDVEPPQEIAMIRFADLRKDEAGELRKLVLAIRENHGR